MKDHHEKIVEEIQNNSKNINNPQARQHHHHNQNTQSRTKTPIFQLPTHHHQQTPCDTETNPYTPSQSRNAHNLVKSIMKKKT